MNYKRIFYYYWRIAKKYNLAIFFILFLGIGRIAFSFIAGGYIYKLIIDTLNNDLLDIEIKYDIILILLVAIAFSFLISLFTSRMLDYTKFRFTTRVVKELYDFTFIKILNHSYGFFSNNFSGSLVTKTKRFIQSFETFANVLIDGFWPIFLSILFTFGALYLQSKVLAFYLLIWSVLYFGLVLFFLKKKIQIDLKWAESDSKITGYLSDSITNIFNIKIFSALTNQKKEFSEFSTDLKKTSFMSLKFWTIRATVQAFFMVCFHVFILYTMINLWKDGEITIGVFVMAYIYLVGLFDRIWDLATNINTFVKATTDAKEMVDIFDKPIDIMDPEIPEKLNIKNGEIEFKNVFFEYNNDNEVFTNFNLKITPGEKIGLVGHSGSGKTTITKMLLRFVDIKSGDILIDGQNIKNITQDDLRSVISYVPQDPILFHRSIGENIGYSKENATQEEIVASSKKAHADEFIAKLPKGYDTLVGERGIKLSGGERQRVAIARAMLKNSPILVLDEATSSLDSISEVYIQESLNELMKGKTAIVIAHRLSTIAKMDRIIVLDKGMILEQGTHQELLDKGGMYTKLWDHQTGFLNEE
ncbi:MAG: ABC transporter ATP-binding protein [Candidatus Paceibacterota bacterium]